MLANEACTSLLAADGLSVATISTAHGSFRIALRQNDSVSEGIRAESSWEGIKSPEDLMAPISRGTHGVVRMRDWPDPFSEATHRAVRVTDLPAENRTFLDVGANMGYYSLLMAQAGYTSIAVEAMGHNRRAIQASRCLNPHLAARVTIVAAALAAPLDVGKGPCVAFSLRRNSGNGRLICGPQAQHANCSKPRTLQGLLDRNVDDERYGIKNCELLQTQTLDGTLLALHGGVRRRIDVVKMDVESFECNVLAGAQQLLDAQPRFLLIEGTFLPSCQCVHILAVRPAAERTRMRTRFLQSIYLSHHAFAYAWRGRVVPFP